MSRTESFAELAARLQREREAEKPKNYALEGPARRPPLPAPLRLPRRRQPLPERRRPDALPPPLDTGIISLRPGAYQHRMADWRWDPIRSRWIGRCLACKERFTIGDQGAGELEEIINEMLEAEDAARTAREALDLKEYVFPYRS